MDVRNCRGCGRLFNYLGGTPLCPACVKELDEKFTVVKQYIYDNPAASVQQVAEDNDVSVQQLKKWVREERLCFSENSVVGLECENCGTMIRTGRFCPQCKDKIANTLNNAYEKPAPIPVQQPKSPKDKMRFLDNNK
jgi:flagellar operon protein (TIGR03826 family)